MVFVSLLPIITLLIYNLTIGQAPSSLKLGVINNEIPVHCSYQSFNICDNEIPLSCKLINEIGKNGLVLVINILCTKYKNVIAPITMFYEYKQSLVIYPIGHF